MTDAAHAGLMDGVYRRQRHIYDLTRKYYLLGRDRLIDGLSVPDGGSVLEVGCGTGRNLIAAAKRYPKARLFGVDISDEMLITARASIESAGLSNRIVVRRGDATSFCPAELFGEGDFDRVFVSYALSMIPQWEASISNALGTLKPGGTVHLVDFGAQEGLPTWFKAVLHSWLAQFHVAPRADLSAVLTALADTHNGRATVQSLYRGYAVLATIGGLQKTPT